MRNNDDEEQLMDNGLTPPRRGKNLWRDGEESVEYIIYGINTQIAASSDIRLNLDNPDHEKDTLSITGETAIQDVLIVHVDNAASDADNHSHFYGRTQFPVADGDASVVFIEKDSSERREQLRTCLADKHGVVEISFRPVTRWAPWGGPGA